jgi:hypothetical protein
MTEGAVELVVLAVGGTVREKNEMNGERKKKDSSVLLLFLSFFLSVCLSVCLSFSFFFLFFLPGN